MKNIILATLFIFAFGAVQAQYLPFQGKLYEEGQPFNGTKNFQFSIASLNWTETHNNVNINRGLYAVVLGSIRSLPDNVFTAAQRKRELVVSVDGQQLDIVDIYAPWESDADPTNELQTLRKSEDSLFISKGNFVLLDQSGPASINELFVGPPETRTNEVGQTSGADERIATEAWQSFRPEETGVITAIKLVFDNINNAPFSVYVTNGEGPGQAIGSTSFFTGSDFPRSGDLLLQTIELAEPIPVEAFQTYTFLVSSNTNLAFGLSPVNAYENGKSNFGDETDLKFLVTVEYTRGGYMSVTDEGTELRDLKVDGRIRDKSGLVMPVGTILPYAGGIGLDDSNLPEGWLICDGKSIDKNQYIDLFNVIGERWGKGDNENQFRLPDLRGAFLRGVSRDGDISKAPDRDTRYNLYEGGRTGNVVGSYQDAEIVRHAHGFQILIGEIFPSDLTYNYEEIIDFGKDFPYSFTRFRLTGPKTEERLVSTPLTIAPGTFRYTTTATTIIPPDSFEINSPPDRNFFSTYLFGDQNNERNFNPNNAASDTFFLTKNRNPLEVNSIPYQGDNKYYPNIIRLTDTGGSETRPYNAAVNYIIKY